MSEPISVSALNRYVDDLLSRDAKLNPVRVRGEISGFKTYPSGHLYFSLKDAEAAVSCVMFRGHAQHLRFQPQNGQKVVLTGRASVYDRDGRYQLITTVLEEEGVGDLHLAFEQLKKKLSAEGLFASERKRAIPDLPRLIGVITSPAGAVIRDILHVLSRRYPNFRLQLMPTPVQGSAAAPAIAAAIRAFNRLGQADVLIVARGGGSIEDLWPFNEEIVARAVAESQIPVISAVGHETDYTICDFVADLRAPTPSAAAELVMPVKAELQYYLDHQRRQLAAALRRTLERHRTRLAGLITRPVLTRPAERVRQARTGLTGLNRRLCQSMTLSQTRAVARQEALRNSLAQAMNRLNDRRISHFRLLTAKLDTLSPLRTLARGYSFVMDPERGTVLASTALTRPGDAVEVWLADGTLTCTVDAVNERRYPT